MFRNSLALAKASWNVLREDKKLTVFPVFSGIATVIAAALFFVPVGLIASGSDGFTPVAWVLTFIAYVVLAFIVIFFNSALVFAADKRLRGEEVTVGEALQSSMERIHVLLPWAVVSATVSIVLRAVEQRAGFLGRIVVGLIGVAWTLVTFLVLPVLVFEKTGPIEAVIVELKGSNAPTGTIPTSRPDVAITQLFDNPRARAIKAVLQPAFHEAPGTTHDFDQVVIALAPAVISLQLDGKPAKTSWKAGDAEFIGRGVKHESKNNGQNPADVFILAIK